MWHKSPFLINVAFVVIKNKRTYYITYYIVKTYINAWQFCFSINLRHLYFTQLLVVITALVVTRYFTQLGHVQIYSSQYLSKKITSTFPEQFLKFYTPTTARKLQLKILDHKRLSSQHWKILSFLKRHLDAKIDSLKISCCARLIYRKFLKD